MSATATIIVTKAEDSSFEAEHTVRAGFAVSQAITDLGYDASQIEMVAKGADASLESSYVLQEGDTIEVDLGRTAPKAGA